MDPLAYQEIIYACMTVFFYFKISLYVLSTDAW
jgi:hypothetical protein